MDRTGITQERRYRLGPMDPVPVPDNDDGMRIEWLAGRTL